MTKSDGPPDKTMHFAIVVTILFLSSAILGNTTTLSEGYSSKNTGPTVNNGPRTLGVTDIFFSTTADGQLRKIASTYNSVWNAGSAGTINTSGTTAIIGQAEDTDPGTTEYIIYRSFFYFDTSYIPDDAVISSASLSLYGAHKKTGSGAFNIQIQNGQPTYPHDTLEAGDYDKDHYSGDGGSFGTGSFTTDGFNTITLTPTGLTWINKVGITKLCVRNSEEIAGNEPNIDSRDWVSVCTANEEDYEPYLQVTYIANVPPDPPTLHSPADGGLTDCAPTFSWTFSDPDAGDTQQKFVVKVNPKPDFSGVDEGSGIVTSSNNYWTSGSPYAEGTWYWKCRVHDGTEWGDFSQTQSFTVLSVCDIPLEAGWNLISLNVIPPDTVIATVLSSIDGKYEIVRSYDGGELTYDPAYPVLSDLTDMDAYHGYWIKMTESATLSVWGYKTMTVVTTSSLDQNWNLFSYPLDYELPIEDALQSIDGMYSIVRGYGGGGLTYDPNLPEFSDLHTLKPGFGYWIKMISAGILDFDFEPPLSIHTPVISGIINTDIPITVTVTDFNGISSVTLYYRAIGEGGYTSLPMSGTGTYTGVIPAGDVTVAGIDYYIKAVDASLNLNTIFYGASGQTTDEPVLYPMQISITEIVLDPPTHLFAMQQDNNKIYLGWRLDAENPDVGYNVYRKAPSESSYFMIAGDITDSTNYLDTTVTDGQSYYYYVRAVDDDEIESEDSNVATITAGSGTNRYKYIPNILPNHLDPQVKIGDINADGLTDFMVLCREDTEHNTHAKVYRNTGNYENQYELACDIDTGESENTNLYAWTMWDMDCDGKSDLVGALRHGSETDGEYYMHVMDAETGDDKVTPVQIVDNHGGSQVRMHYKSLAIAYLKGKSWGPFIIYMSGHKVHTTALDVQTFDANLAEYWHWHVDKQPTDEWETEVAGSHQFEVADLDDDGRDELIHGAYVFDDDGSYLWPHPCDPAGLYMWHVDGAHIGDIIPSNPGQEIYFHVETPRQRPDGTPNAGVYVTDINGNELWRSSRKKHAHEGWLADITGGPGFDGMEVWVHFKIPDLGGMVYPTLYSSQGSEVEIKIRNPIDWDGDEYKEIFHESKVKSYYGPTNTTTTIYNYPSSGDVFVYDIIGDYREEFIVMSGGTGVLHMYVYTNTDVLSMRAPSPWEDLQYAEKHSWGGH